MRKLPVVFSMEEVARLLAAVPGIKAQAALTVAYAARRGEPFKREQIDPSKGDRRYP